MNFGTEKRGRAGLTAELSLADLCPAVSYERAGRADALLPVQGRRPANERHQSALRVFLVAAATPATGHGWAVRVRESVPVQAWGSRSQSQRGRQQVRDVRYGWIWRTRDGKAASSSSRREETRSSSKFRVVAEFAVDVLEGWAGREQGRCARERGTPRWNALPFTISSGPIRSYETRECCS